MMREQDVQQASNGERGSRTDLARVPPVCLLWMYSCSLCARLILTRLGTLHRLLLNGWQDKVFRALSDPSNKFPQALSPSQEKEESGDRERIAGASKPTAIEDGQHGQGGSHQQFTVVDHVPTAGSTAHVDNGEGSSRSR